MNAPALSCTLLAAVTLLGVGCAARPISDGTSRTSTSLGVGYESRNLKLRLLDVLDADDSGALVIERGWREYLIEAENVGDSPLIVQDVKLLNREGRYLSSAASFQEISATADAGEQIAEDVARRSAAIAAGQVIPYGGAIVGVLSGALSASRSQSEAEARHSFTLRRIKNVELAPGGRISGSAFLPDIDDASALIIDWTIAGQTERIELPLRR
jgi:hypothetical protein